MLKINTTLTQIFMNSEFLMIKTQKGVDDECLQMVFLIDAQLGTMEKKSSQKHGEHEVENWC